MKIYASHGHSDFVVACGYRAGVIKEYFHSFFVRHSDYVLNLKDGTKDAMRSEVPDWRIAVVDTGLHTLTGSRIWRLREWLKDEPFMVTYGDGIGDINIGALIAFHQAHRKLATVTAVRPPARFGRLTLDGPVVAQFSEKSQAAEGWINGGFFVFEPQVLDILAGDSVSLEREPMERLAASKQLAAYRHEGFWRGMDTLHDHRELEALWAGGKAPWKTW
jgi:glucose-1-phosphate cytidylyltransferase